MSPSPTNFILSLFLEGGGKQGERERENKHEQERGRERRGRIPSRLRAVSTEPDAGLELTNCKTMTWAETKSRRLRWVRHPGTPSPTNFIQVWPDTKIWEGQQQYLKPVISKSCWIYSRNARWGWHIKINSFHNCRKEKENYHLRGLRQSHSWNLAPNPDEI